MKRILSLSLLIFLALASNVIAWTTTMTFESGTVGNVANDVFSEAGTETKYSTTYAHGGTKSVAMYWTTGATGFSTCNATYDFPTAAGEGAEVWTRVYYYFPAGWSWTTNSYNKILRYHTDTTNISILSDTSGTVIGNSEVTGTNFYPAHGGVQTTYTVGTWQCFEMYIKFSRTAGRIRLWKDGIMQYDAAAATLPASYDTTGIMIASQWNGGAPQNQYQYIDDVVVTNSTPANVDADGNAMIGPTDWGAPSTYTVTGASVSNGSISCTSPVNSGSTTTCTLTPNPGYSSASASSDTCGGSLTANTYTTGAVSSNCIVTPVFSATSSVTTLLSEKFDDPSFTGRGWFDTVPASIDTSVKQAGAGSLALTWGSGAGAIYPSALAGLMRKTFTATDELYITFYWRFNSNWVGSGYAYDPHIIHVLSNSDSEWAGPSRSYLDSYVEVNNVSPRLLLQDSLNVASSPIPPWGTTNSTETRAIGGCNGDTTGADAGNSVNCYQYAGLWYNGRQWNGTSNFSLNQWQKVEVYQRMNTISGNIGQPDGIMWMKIDGNYVVNKTNVIYRTNLNPTLKWSTFIIAPYMGNGSPQAQTMWMDELTVMNGIPSSTTPTFNGSITGGQMR